MKTSQIGGPALASSIGVHRPSFSGFSGRMAVRFKDGGGEGDQGKGGEGDQGKGDQGGAGKLISMSQEDLNDLVESRLGKERKKHEGTISDLQRQLDELKGKGDKGGDKGGDQGKGKAYSQEDVQSLIAKEWEPKLKASTETITKLQTRIKTSEIKAAAADANAYDSDEVAALLDRSVGFDEEGELVVLDEKGNVVLGDKGKPLPVKEFVAAYLEKKPHLVKGSGTNGAGSGTQQTGNGKQQPKTGIGKIAAGLSGLR